MKLIELNPSCENDCLCFDCPKCRRHRIEIPIPPHPQAWQKTGETFENVTLSPSIAHKVFVYTDIKNDPTKGEYCESHFFIRNGEIVNA